MIKNRLDYKLVNVAIVCLIVFLLYQTSNFWLGFVQKAWSIIMPFFFAFAIAYALYPFLEYLRKKKIPKGISVTIIVALILGIAILLLVLVVPMLFDQLKELFGSILTFVKELSLNHDLNLGDLQKSLNTAFNQIISTIGMYVSNGAISAVNSSLSAITLIFICFSSAIYFLIDMDKIRNSCKKFLKRTSMRAYEYFAILDDEMKRYLSGFIKISIISIFEYGIVYALLGHPNALLLGVLACIGGLIPYFGGMAVNVVAAITSFVVSPALFIKTCIAFCVLSQVDGYLINPMVYGKTNKIHPIVGIAAVFAFGILFGITGIIVSMPLAIALCTTYKFFKEDIICQLSGVKEK